MKLRPIGYEDRLSIIDHLDELRSRIFVCAAVLFVAFGVCFWQNHALLSALNRALPPAAKTGLGAQGKVNATLSSDLRGMQRTLDSAGRLLSESKSVPSGVGAYIQQAAHYAGHAASILPSDASAQVKPIAIGVGEGFTITVVVCAYFALLVTLPVILYEFYAFVVPGLSRDERKIATPTVIAAPLLFLAGAVFTYFAVLPPAIHFLQGYNSSEFQNLVQAKSYYRFEILLMMGIGLAFQVPLLALGLQRVGVISSSTLTLNWRYATVLIAVIVAALPGVDPVTMTMEMLPLVGLYIASIVLLKWVEYRNFRRARAEAAKAAQPGDAAGDSSSAS
jgi:sec-independent protein translocase protein TatC